MVSSSGPLTLMKLAWHSLAMALASSVFPHPAQCPACLILTVTQDRGPPDRDRGPRTIKDTDVHACCMLRNISLLDEAPDIHSLHQPQGQRPLPQLPTSTGG